VNILDGTTTFMQKAGQPIGEHFNNPQLRRLRIRLLAEEMLEYVTAERDDNLVEAVDGLLDIIVIAWGTLLSYVGEDKAKAAEAEVVRSNLDKVIGEGLPIFREDGKVMKPEGWRPPDIAKAIS